jgi:peroxiredoxin/Tfp pilus assembly protein PilF
MKKKIITIIVTGLFIPLHLLSNTPPNQINTDLIQLTPARPQHNETITIQYDPWFEQDLDLNNLSNVSMVIYQNLLDQPEIIPMNEETEKWITQFTLTDSVTGMILFYFKGKVPSGEIMIDNDGQLWDVLIYNKLKRPLKGAYMTRAISFSGQMNERKENLDLALNAIKTELSLYPDNWEAKRLRYNILLRTNKYSKNTRKTIEKEIDNYLKQYPDDLTMMNFAAEIYKMIGQTEKTQKTEQIILNLDPAGSQAGKKVMKEIMELEDAEKRFQALEQFLKDFSDAGMIEFALSQMATTAIELDDSVRIISSGDSLLNSAASHSGASGLAGIAGVLVEKKIELDRALSYSRKALSIINTLKLSDRPSGISMSEWKKERLKTEARYRDILGWTLFNKGETELALKELKEAEKNMFQPLVFQHLAAVLEESGDIDSALINYVRAAAFGGDIGNEAYESLEYLWSFDRRNDSLMDKYLKEQEQWVEQTYNKRILSRRNIRPAPDFLLTDISNNRIRLSEQEGNVILLCFWATWSQASHYLVQELQILAKDYGKDALFITVAMDREKSDVRAFVKKNRIFLPVLYNNKTDRAYGLRGVPMVFVIDTDGNIHFEHKGYRPDIQQVLTVELKDLMGN